MKNYDELHSEYYNLKFKYNMLMKKKDELEQIYYDMIERYETLYKQVYGDKIIHNEYQAPRKLKDEDKMLLGGKKVE